MIGLPQKNLLLRIPFYAVLLYVASLLTYSSCGKNEGNNPLPVDTTSTQKTFANPLMNGADPWVIERNGTYYYTHTLGNRIGIWKTDAVTDLKNASPVIVYTPSPGKENSEHVWAPEIHYLDSAWYIYYTAGAGNDSTQRSWVLENKNSDPTTGTWNDKGRIYNDNLDIWAIDGTVLTYNNEKYFLWSGRPVIGIQNQNLYISKMTNPWTLEGSVTMISKPDLAWELNGPVNEGPEVLINPDGDIFVVYSASGCWTDDYALGYLRLKDGGDPMKADDWQKSPNAVFKKNVQGNAFGPGHNSFFKSPDGKEDWIIYHANSNSGDGCGNKRNVRIQKFTWNADGSPNFGVPVATGQKINVPAGE